MIRFFLFLVCFNICFFYDTLAQKSTKDTLYVESVDFNILTFSRVTCEVFTTSFEGRIKFKAVSQDDTIKILKSYLNKIRYARKDRDIDVRAKFIYNDQNNSKVIICTNGNDILIGGRLIKQNSKFANFLFKLAN